MPAAVGWVIALYKGSLILLFALSAVVAGAVVAGADEAARASNKLALAPQAGISLQDATAIVRQAYGGRIVSAVADERRLGKRAERRGYRVRVDVNGRVKTVFVDYRGRIYKPGG